MKVNELFEGRTISFKDPDYEPGAVEREGNARASLKDRQEIAVKNLNALSTKYKLGTVWKVGSRHSASATDIMTDNAKSTKSKFTTSAGIIDTTFWVAGNYEDLVLTFNGVDITKEEKATYKAKIEALIPGEYGISLYPDDRKSFTSLSIRLGSPSSYSDPKKFAGLKKVLELIKKEFPFKGPTK